jgi:hypothetical protein
MGTAPALAESTAGVRPAGEAEKATTAKPEALIPWVQDEAADGLERLPREGKYMHESPPKAWASADQAHSRTERVSAKPTRCRRVSPVTKSGRRGESASASLGYCKSRRRARISCPLGRDQALGIQEGCR